MDPRLELFLWIAKVFAWLALAWSLYRIGWAKRYPIISAYAGIGILVDLLMNFAASRLGIGARLYLSLFIAASLLMLSLSAAVVLRIYAMLGKIWAIRHLHLAIAPLFISLIVFADPARMSVPVRILNCVYVSVMYFGLATSLRMVLNPGFDLGWNLKMALMSISIPVSLYSVMFILSSLGFEISYRYFDTWMRSVWAASWVILAVGMMEVSSPQQRTAERARLATPSVVEAVDELEPKADREDAHALRR